MRWSCHYCLRAGGGLAQVTRDFAKKTGNWLSNSHRIGGKMCRNTQLTGEEPMAFRSIFLGKAIYLAFVATGVQVAPSP